MAYSYDSYTGDGSTTDFNVTFSFIARTDVDVKVDGTPVSFTWLSDTQVRCDTAPSNGASVVIIRDTQKTSRLVDYQTASMLDEETLDKDSNQLLYITQEAFDALLAAIALDTADSKYDADNKVIKNLGAAVNPNDAVRLVQISTYLTAAQAAQTAAEAAQTAAETAKTNAETAETNAETAETNAETAETNAETAEAMAEEWAEKAEDSPITGNPGKYSALHHSAKAALTLTDCLRYNVTREFTKALNFNETSLTDGATISWDVESNQVATVTLAGNRTMAAPTNLKAGGTYILQVVQDGTGNRTLSWNAVFKWDNDITPDLVYTASKRTIFIFKSDGTNLYGAVFYKEE
jgi:hypothetical protein